MVFFYVYLIKMEFDLASFAIGIGACILVAVFIAVVVYILGGGQKHIPSAESRSIYSVYPMLRPDPAPIPQQIPQPAQQAELLAQIQLARGVEGEGVFDLQPDEDEYEYMDEDEGYEDYTF